MSEITEAEQQKLNTGRLMRAESDMILPMLATKQTLVIANIVAAFKAGAYERLTAHAAELSTLSDMKAEITSKIRQAEAIERKLYGE